MSRSPARVGRNLALAAGGVALLAGLALCTLALSFFDLALPRLGRGAAAAATPVVWAGLPQPVAVHPQWTSFTFANAVRGLAVHDRLLWAATDGGAVVFDLGAPNAAPVKFTVEHGLAGNRLTSVAAGPDGAIWFGTVGNGVSRYDGTGWQTYTTAEGLPANEVRDLAFAPDGALWAATPRGLARLEGDRWQTFTTLWTGLESDDIRGVAAGAGGVWAATGQGVTHYDGQAWETFTFQQGLANDEARDVALAADGTVWVATRVGLSRYDGSSWRRFTTADGLTANAVQAVAVTPGGEVWVAYGEAGGGLTRYDGTAWQTYTMVDGLPEDTVMAVGVGPGGEVLAGTVAGVSVFDGVGWRALEGPSELPTNEVRGLVAGRGAVWVGTAAGVSRYDGARWRAYTGRDGLAAGGVYGLALGPGETPWAAFGLPTYGVSYLQGPDRWATRACHPAGPASANVWGGAAAADGSVWFATERGVSRFAGGVWTTYTSANGLPADEVSALAIAPTGEVWVGTANGLAVYHAERWNTITTDEVRLVAVAPAGTVWAVTPAGLARLQDGHLVPVPGAPGGAAQPRALAATGRGVWLATGGGVAVWSEAGWQSITEADGLKSNDVTALAAAPDGAVWAGFSDVALGFASLGPDGSLGGVKGPRISGAVRSLAVTSDGSIWFGTSAGGAARYDPTAWPAGPDRALGPREVRAIFQAADGLLWFATAGDGVYRYDGVRWKRYSADPALASAPVQSFALDSAGTAWLGTSAGVVRLEEMACQADSRVARVNAQAAAAAADGVWFATPADGALRWNLDGSSVWRAANWTGTNVTALTRAPDGAIWFFGDKGLARLLAREWQVLPPDSGLFPDGALSLAVAPDGDVWAGTPHGVRHYDGREWRAFTPRDGLADDVVHFVLAAPDGSLWFATPGGLSRYRP